MTKVKKKKPPFIIWVQLRKHEIIIIILVSAYLPMIILIIYFIGGKQVSFIKENENKIEILEKWEGKVTKISEDEFEVYSSKTDSCIIFDYEDVSEHFRKNIKIGAKVTYIRQYETTPGGQKKKVSFLEFYLHEDYINTKAWWKPDTKTWWKRQVKESIKLKRDL